MHERIGLPIDTRHTQRCSKQNDRQKRCPLQTYFEAFFFRFSYVSSFRRSLLKILSELS